MTTSLEQSRAHALTTAAGLAKKSSREAIEAFLGRYYRHVATEDLLARTPEDLLGAALAHEDLARERPVGTAKVLVDNPSVETQGWSSGHTVVQVVTDDMPFLVDSVAMALTRRGRAMHLVVHPQLIVERDAAGHLVQVRDTDGKPDSAFGVGAESWMHLEIDRVSDPAERAAIAEELRAVLDDVRVAVEDWPKMRAHCRELADGLRADAPVGLPAAEVEQSIRFLEWLGPATKNCSSSPRPTRGPPSTGRSTSTTSESRPSTHRAR